jgi:Domain of unknown function (DUF4398)
MRTPFKAAGLASMLVLLAIALPACGGVYYVATVNGAASKLEEARILGADTLAPFEYYYAKEHLQEAQLEASEASYSDAAHYAETAEEYAEKAVQLAQAAHRAAGRP